MKTLKVKLNTSLIVFTLAAGLVGPALADVQLPQKVNHKIVESSLISQGPKFNAAFNEGVETKLSAEDIQSILPWAENSMTFLTQALEDIKGMPYSEKERMLLHAIQGVVLASAPKNSELLMRYVLNRGLRIHWLI